MSRWVFEHDVSPDAGGHPFTPAATAREEGDPYCMPPWNEHSCPTCRAAAEKPPAPQAGAEVCERYYCRGKSGHEGEHVFAASDVNKWIERAEADALERAAKVIDRRLESGDHACGCEWTLEEIRDEIAALAGKGEK
jgi:hypothetical protein